MISLQDIFDNLSYGELEQLYIGGVGGGIQPKDYPKIISAVNLGLTALYSRFPMVEKELTIQQYDHITEYFLDTKYAQSNVGSVEPIKYILDSEFSPFLDDILRITAAYNELGEEVVLNDEYDSASWFTPSYDSIQIPYPLNDNTATFIYRANHPKIPLNVVDPSSVEVLVHATLFEALLAYVASRVYSARITQESVALGQTMAAKYEYICLQVELKNLLHTNEAAGNHKLDTGGWV